MKNKKNLAAAAKQKQHSKKASSLVEYSMYQPPKPVDTIWVTSGTSQNISAKPLDRQRVTEEEARKTAAELLNSGQQAANSAKGTLSPVTTERGRQAPNDTLPVNQEDVGLSGSTRLGEIEPGGKTPKKKKKKKKSTTLKPVKHGSGHPEPPSYPPPKKAEIVPEGKQNLEEGGGPEVQDRKSVNQIRKEQEDLQKQKEPQTEEPGQTLVGSKSATHLGDRQQKLWGLVNQ